MSSMSCGKHLQEAVDEPFQHTAMPKCFLNPNYPIIFTFSQSQTKIHHLNVCNQNSFKSFQEAVGKLFQHITILKGILCAIKHLFAPLTQYLTKMLPESSRSFGILQTPSGSSGRAIPAYFYVEMYPKPHLKFFFSFWSILNKNSSSKCL